MSEEQFRWAHGPHDPPPPGWLPVLTPLGGSAHVAVGSQASDVCSEWQLLQSGRGALCITNPHEWFSDDELSGLPCGLLAELLAAGGKMNECVHLLRVDEQARTHVLLLANHLFGATSEEWALVGHCVDVALAFRACLAARVAAREAEGL